MRTVQEKKMLKAMEDPEEREALLDLIKNRLSGGKLVSHERLMECAGHKAFDALLDLECMLEEDAELFSQ